MSVFTHAVNASQCVYIYMYVPLAIFDRFAVGSREKEHGGLIRAEYCAFAYEKKAAAQRQGK